MRRMIDDLHPILQFNWDEDMNEKSNPLFFKDQLTKLPLKIGLHPLFHVDVITYLFPNPDNVLLARIVVKQMDQSMYSSTPYSEIYIGFHVLATQFCLIFVVVVSPVVHGVVWSISKIVRDASLVLGQDWISSLFYSKPNAHTFKINGMFSSHYWKERIDLELWNSDQKNVANLSGPDPGMFGILYIKIMRAGAPFTFRHPD